MGMFESDSLYQYNGGTDYWIQNMPLRSEKKNEKVNYAVRLRHEDRAHGHMYPNRIVFHSHMHHLL